MWRRGSCSDIGTGLLFQWLGLNASWYTSALGAQLSWTLPFGVLVMFAVMSRFDDAWEEAARDLGANRWQIIRLVVSPILAPGLVAVALFGFTLSYDEFARTPADGRLAQHPAARDLEHDAQCHLALALCPRHGDDSRLLHRSSARASVRSCSSRSGAAAASFRTREARNDGLDRGDIEFAGVCKSYDGVTNVVDGVNLKIADGAYCCFLGPSGCGKTTILRMIAGHEDPTAGEILIGGENVVGLAPVARRTAMMFQSYALFPHLTVRDNIAFRTARARHVEDRSRARRRCDDRKGPA